MRLDFRRGVICGAIAYLLKEGRKHGTKSMRFTLLADELGISRNTIEKHCKILEENECAEILREDMGGTFAWGVSLLVDDFVFRSLTGYSYSAKELYDSHNTYVNKKTKIRILDMFR